MTARIKELDLDSIARPWITTSQVREWIDTGKIGDLTEHPTDVPYLTFTHDGKKYCPYTVSQALELFVSDEVGNPQLEVTDLFLQKPSFFVGRGLDAAGSRNEHGGVPRLDMFFGGPRVDACSPDSDYCIQCWGVASRGKDIIRLGA